MPSGNDQDLKQFEKKKGLNYSIDLFAGPSLP